MKTRLFQFTLFLAIVVPGSVPVNSTAFAQDINAVPKVQNAKGMYTVLPAKLRSDLAFAPLVALPTWNGSFTYQGTKYGYNMVGSAPSTNASTTIAAIIIPVKIVITGRRGAQTVYDPAHILTNGNSVTTNTVQSPIFDSTTTYVQGGVNVGTTQYIDAYQRANFWG